jgi:hypothetical protein
LPDRAALDGHEPGREPREFRSRLREEIADPDGTGALVFPRARLPR